MSAAKSRDDEFARAGKVIREAFFGPDPTPEQIAERIRIQQEAQVDRWRRETHYGSWMVWPFWMGGRLVGLAVALVREICWNIRNGYLRSTTSPWTWDEDEDDG